MNKWYFDELYDALSTARCSRSAGSRTTSSSGSSSRGSSPAAVDVVRGVGVLVRGAQSGFVRAYALLLIGGFAALGLYFLIVSS